MSWARKFIADKVLIWCYAIYLRLNRLLTTNEVLLEMDLTLGTIQTNTKRNGVVDLAYCTNRPSAWCSNGMEWNGQMIFNATKMPVKAHENILVFYNKTPSLNPQKQKDINSINTYNQESWVCNKTEVYGKVKQDVSGGGLDGSRWPRKCTSFCFQINRKQTRWIFIHPNTGSHLLYLEICKNLTQMRGGDVVNVLSVHVQLVWNTWNANGILLV